MKKIVRNLGIGIACWVLGGLSLGATVYTPEGSIQLYTAQPSQGIVISYNGNIGLGTTLPTERLSVVGTGSFTGTVSANKFIGNGWGITSLNWDAISNPPAVVTTGMIIGYANTANIALTANKLATMSVLQFSNDAQYVTAGQLAAVVGGGLPDNSILDSKIVTINAAKVIQNRVVITGVYSVGATNSLISASNAGATYSVTLPNPNTMTDHTVTIKKTDANNNWINVVTSSGSFDGTGYSSTPLMSQGDSVTVMSDGTNWLIVGRR